VYCESEDNDTRIRNCTFVRNTAPLGAAIYNAAGSFLRLRNSILWRNIGFANINGTGPRVVRYNNIQGGHPGPGNINVHPRFIDWPNGELHLRPDSPCIDAGRNSYLPPEFVVDADGNPRFQDHPGVPDSGIGSPAVVDMGAYEFQPD
jgi:hypothetical protein